MTNKGMFEDAIKLEKQDRKIKRLNMRIKELMEINKEHQQMNGKLHSELEIEKKNHTITREDNDMLNKEIGRLMKKIQEKSS
jgi:predicted RNase H-like nuclease (RuvC/YqgF family)